MLVGFSHRELGQYKHLGVYNYVPIDRRNTSNKVTNKQESAAKLLLALLDEDNSRTLRWGRYCSKGHFERRTPGSTFGVVGRIRTPILRSNDQLLY